MTVILTKSKAQGQWVVERGRAHPAFGTKAGEHAAVEKAKPLLHSPLPILINKIAPANR